MPELDYKREREETLTILENHIRKMAHKFGMGLQFSFNDFNETKVPKEALQEIDNYINKKFKKEKSRADVIEIE